MGDVFGEGKPFVLRSSEIEWTRYHRGEPLGELARGKNGD